jgi:hypothetical protein
MISKLSSHKPDHGIEYVRKPYGGFLIHFNHFCSNRKQKSWKICQKRRENGRMLAVEQRGIRMV